MDSVTFGTLAVEAYNCTSLAEENCFGIMSCASTPLFCADESDGLKSTGGDDHHFSANRNDTNDIKLPNPNKYILNFFIKKRKIGYVS